MSIEKSKFTNKGYLQEDVQQALVGKVVLIEHNDKIICISGMRCGICTYCDICPIDLRLEHLDGYHLVKRELNKLTPDQRDVIFQN